jgi:hypothetical protein
MAEAAYHGNVATVIRAAAMVIVWVGYTIELIVAIMLIVLTVTLELLDKLTDAGWRLGKFWTDVASSRTHFKHNELCKAGSRETKLVDRHASCC